MSEIIVRSTDNGEAHEHDDCTSPNISETSTIQYEQENFDSFQSKVLSLMLSIFQGSREETIKIERMKGGSYNRVIGITISQPDGNRLLSWQTLRRVLSKCVGIRDHKKYENDAAQYILRIPRWNAVDMDYDVATLEYVAQNLQYPIPRVVSYDMSENNELGKGYMLQHRLVGQPLQLIWDSLNFEQQRSMAHQVTEIIQAISKITSTSAGILSRSNTITDLKANKVSLESFPIPKYPDPELTKPARYPSPPQSTKDLLLEMCKRWKDYEHTIDPDFTQDEVWDGFIKIINSLYDAGFLPDHEAYHLCHQDLQTRNILVEYVDGSAVVKVTGILDWDSAIFAPKFVSYRAPFFLWDNEDSREDDEDLALHVPEDPDLMAFKNTFEVHADPEFLHYAYAPEFIIARRMFHVLQRGISATWELTEAKEIIQDSEKLFAPCTKYTQ